MSIVWKGVRQGRKVSIGTFTAMGEPCEWIITKSLGGLHYGLHLVDVKEPAMITRATITECKQYAEEYFA